MGSVTVGELGERGGDGAVTCRQAGAAGETEAEAAGHERGGQGQGRDHARERQQPQRAGAEVHRPCHPGDEWSPDRRQY